MNQFTWITAFKAIADWIIAYENRQPELIGLLQKIGVDNGLNDKNSAGDREEQLREIDPFTFYCLINKYSPKRRGELVAALIDSIGLDVEKPVDFDGVPSANAMKAWMFPSADVRTPEMIQTLWQLFKAAGEGGLHSELFARALAIPNVGFSKLTECLFYAFPEKYFPVDKQTKPWLKSNGIAVPDSDWEAFQECLTTIRQRFSEPFWELSHRAWSSNQPGMFSAAGAMAYLDDRFPNTYSGTSHIAAYRCEDGRQMAFDPGADPSAKKKISLFIDSKPDGSLVAGSIKGYAPDKSRNHHLNQHAPALASGQQAYAVAIKSLEELESICDWYSGMKSVSHALRTEIETEQGPAMTTAKNQILYGPPGTGKTWSTTEYAVRLADPGFYTGLKSQALDAGAQRAAIQQHYQALCEDGRIVFTTFHQSFSYEDFVEGIRAVVDEETQELSYKVQPGVLRELAERAGKAVGRSGGLQLAESPRVWKLSIGRTGDKALREQYVESGEARIGWNDTGDLNEEYDDRSADEQAYFDKLKQNARSTVLDFSENMQVGDVVLCLKDKSTIQHVGIVSSDYFYDPLSSPATPHYAHARKVNWVLKDIDFNILRLNNNKALTLKTCYQLKRISWDDLVGELAKQGYTLSDVDSTSEEKPGYVLIIDEINRGNISRIFGELITLLEPDKRKGASDAREVVLPYSKELFSVPGNLHVLGTMNTADKSLAQLDLALRRRFEFVELLPEPETLASVTVHGIPVSDLLNLLNQRIEVLLDRDHTIGHAYFWSLRDSESEAERERLLAQIFETRVIPLLQEYFFADWERIGWVLNDPAKAYDARFIQTGQVGMSVANLFSGDLSNEINDRRYRINRAALTNPASYVGILTAAEPAEE